VRVAYETIELNDDGPVARLTLNRPEKLNALDVTMFDEIVDAVERLSHNDTVGTVLLTGAGRAFCSGVDVESPLFFASGVADAAYAATRGLSFQHRLITALHGLPQLTLAGVNGDAVGGAGFGMAMACDMRVSVRNARFWMVPGMLAVIQDFGLSWLLQRQIGASRTLQLAVLGEATSAETGRLYGFVDTLVEDQQELEAHLDSVAERLATMGVDALRMLKLMVRAGAGTTLHDQLGVEAVANGLASHSREFADRRAHYLSGVRARRKQS
jgi:enoyl-CoA hydratase/carnithine racemase